MRGFLFLLLVLAGLAFTFRKSDFVRSIVDIDSWFGGQSKQPETPDPSDVPEVKDPPASRYADIDQHALDAPEDREKSISTLADYLAEAAQTDIEKVRAAFCWVADRIEYDVQGFQHESKLGSQKASDVLRQRKAVCDGSADLFVALVKEMGLKAQKISGFCKGYTFSKTGKVSKDTDHAWAAVELDGVWHLFDPTWSGRGVKDDGKGGLLPGDDPFEEFWFDTKPESFIYTHLPEESRWQLLPQPISKADFEAMPKFSEGFFALGLSPDAEECTDPVNAYAPPCPVQVRNAPINRQLSSKSSYSFAVESPYITRVALVNNDLRDWAYFDQSNHRFSLNYKPKAGKILLVVEYKKDFKTILAYQVD